MVTITDLTETPQPEVPPPADLSSEILDTLQKAEGKLLTELTTDELGAMLAFERHAAAWNTHRVDGNFRRIEESFRHLLDRVEAQLKQKRAPRRARSGSAARLNPDRLEFGWAIAALNGLFILGAFVLVYAGQYAFAKYTQLPEQLWVFIPIALDLPVVSASFTAAIFIKRKQRSYARTNWAVVLGLTVLGSVIQVTHVLDASGALIDSALLSYPLLLMAAVMGLLPWLTMYLSHNLARLLVRPTGETIEKTPAPKRRPAPKKTRSTK